MFRVAGAWNRFTFQVPQFHGKTVARRTSVVERVRMVNYRDYSDGLPSVESRRTLSYVPEFVLNNAYCCQGGCFGAEDSRSEGRFNKPAPHRRVYFLF